MKKDYKYESEKLSVETRKLIEHVSKKTMFNKTRLTHLCIQLVSDLWDARALDFSIVNDRFYVPAVQREYDRLKRESIQEEIGGLK